MACVAFVVCVCGVLYVVCHVQSAANAIGIALCMSKFDMLDDADIEQYINLPIRTDKVVREAACKFVA